MKIDAVKSQGSVDKTVLRTSIPPTDAPITKMSLRGIRTLGCRESMLGTA
jgi:hypothetical protein